MRSTGENRKTTDLRSFVSSCGFAFMFALVYFGLGDEKPCGWCIVRVSSLVVAIIELGRWIVTSLWNMGCRV